MSGGNCANQSPFVVYSSVAFHIHHSLTHKPHPSGGTGVLQIANTAVENVNDTIYFPRHSFKRARIEGFDSGMKLRTVSSAEYVQAKPEKGKWDKGIGKWTERFFFFYSMFFIV